PPAVPVRLGAWRWHWGSATWTSSGMAPSAGIARRSEEAQRLAARAGLEARLVLARRNVDDVDRSIALAGDEQFVAVERHVHGLAADLDGGLIAERRVDEADRAAPEAGDAEHAEVIAVAGDLRRLAHAFEPDRMGDALALGVDQEQRWLRVIVCDHGAAVGGERDPRERTRGCDLAQEFPPGQVDHRHRAVLLVLGIEPPAVERDDQAVAVGRARLD